MSTLLPVTLELGRNGGPTKRTSKLDGAQEYKKDSMKLGVSSECNAGESYRIPEEDEDDNSGDGEVPPNRAATQQVNYLGDYVKHDITL